MLLGMARRNFREIPKSNRGTAVNNTVLSSRATEMVREESCR